MTRGVVTAGTGLVSRSSTIVDGGSVGSPVRGDPVPVKLRNQRIVVRLDCQRESAD